MENTEIMVNEEVIENTAEVACETGKIWPKVATIGGIALGAFVAYKVGKKIVAKIKAKKAAAIEAEFEEVVENEDNSTKEV